MGDTLRDEDFEDLELLLNFFPAADPVRLMSLSAEVADLDLGIDDDLRFLASGFVLDDDKDSFCFLLVGGLCIFVANTLLFLRFLVVVVEQGRCPVTGSRFSFAANPSRLLLVGVDGDDNSDVSVTSEVLGLAVSGSGLSKKTEKLRAAMMSNQ